MLPFGERSVGVGGVTVISGGNLVTVEGMKSFGMLGGTRERIRLGSGSFDCSLPAYCCWSGRQETVNIRPVSRTSRERFRGSDLDVAARCYMWPVPPGTSWLLTPGTGIQWRVSSADKGATPAVGKKVPPRAPPAPLRTKSTNSEDLVARLFLKTRGQWRGIMGVVVFIDKQSLSDVTLLEAAGWSQCWKH